MIRLVFNYDAPKIRRQNSNREFSIQMRIFLGGNIKSIK